MTQTLKPESANATDQNWGFSEIITLLETAKPTKLTAMAHRWLEAEVELDRLQKRTAQMKGDKVMQSVIHNKVKDHERIAIEYANKLSSMPSMTASDIVWKLTASDRVAQRIQTSESTTVSLTRSALYDLLKFMKLSAEAKQRIV